MIDLQDWACDEGLQASYSSSSEKPLVRRRLATVQLACSGRNSVEIVLNCNSIDLSYSCQLASGIRQDLLMLLSNRRLLLLVVVTAAEASPNDE